MPPILGWDTIDESTARMRGWRTQSFAMPDGDPEHLRPRGTHDGLLRGYRRWGECSYALGESPLHVALYTLRQMATERPRVAGGASYAAGYAGAALRRVPRAGAGRARLCAARAEAEDQGANPAQSPKRGTRISARCHSERVFKQTSRGSDPKRPARGMGADTTCSWWADTARLAIFGLSERSRCSRSSLPRRRPPPASDAVVFKPAKTSTKAVTFQRSRRQRRSACCARRSCAAARCAAGSAPTAPAASSAAACCACRVRAAHRRRMAPHHRPRERAQAHASGCAGSRARR